MMDYENSSDDEQVLTIFLVFKTQELVLELSEYCSIGYLKQKICERFDISPQEQIIEGWKVPPENDGTILNFCAHSDDITTLVVKRKDFNTSPTLLKDDENLELESACSFLDKILLNIPSSEIVFHSCRLEDAIKETCLTTKEKQRILLLYLHNQNDGFASVFWRNIQKPQTKQLINRSFYILGWNVEESKYHSALNTALSKHELCHITTLVNKKISAALCIVPIDDSYFKIYCCLRGHYTDHDFLRALYGAEQFLKNERYEEKRLEDLQIDAVEKLKKSTGTENINIIGSEEIQQAMADMLGDRDYDAFEYDQHDELKKKIKFALKGTPEDEYGNYDKETDKQTDHIYNQIKDNNNEYTEHMNRIEIAFIYNCTEPLPEEKNDRAEKIRKNNLKRKLNEQQVYLPKADVTPVPLFIIRKCHDSVDPCRIVIDDTGRVYQSWRDYITENKLPPCEMILPLNGRYEVDKNGKVLLEKHLSPQCSIDTKVLQGFDIGSSVVGLTSGGVVAAAAAVPAIAAAPFVIPIAMATGAVVGIYSIIRSSMTIHDRRIHQEDMSLSSSEARGAYINIAAGCLGIIGAGATLTAAQLASQGVAIGLGGRTLVNVINVVNLSAGGIGIINGSYDVLDQWFNKNQPPSLLTIVQLTSSVFFFSNALYNFKSCGTIIEESQTKTIQDYQESLRSNRHRKTFNKLMKETIRRNDGNTTRGRAEVISTIKNIQNRDEVFAVLTRSNKEMNKQGVRFFAKDGRIQLNGITVDMVEFSSMNNREIGNFISNLGSIPDVTPKEIETMQNLLTNKNFTLCAGAVTYTAKLLMVFERDVKKMIVKALTDLLTTVAQNLINILDTIFPYTLKTIYLVNMAMDFFLKETKELEIQFKKWKSTNDDKYYNRIFDYIDLEKTKHIVEKVSLVVRYAFELTHLTEQTMKKFVNHFITWVSRKIYEWEQEQEKKRRRENYSSQYPRRKVSCKICGGHNYRQNI